MNAARVHCLGALLIALGGCVHAPLLSEKLPPDFSNNAWVLADVPFFAQADYHCGPAALASLLRASAVAAVPEELAPKVYLPARSGSLQIELVAAARRLERVPYVIDPDLSSLLAQVADGRPVLVLQNLGWRRFPVWHYAVVVGFDVATEALILHSGQTARLRMNTRKFLRAWRRGGSWGIVVLRPGEFPSGVDPDRYLQAVSAMEHHTSAAMVEAFFAGAVQRWPDNTLAKLGLANSHLAQGRELEAEHLYRELLNADPDDVPARNNLAHALMRRGCDAAARTELRRARVADRNAGGRYAQILAETAQELEGQRSDRQCEVAATAL